MTGNYLFFLSLELLRNLDIDKIKSVLTLEFFWLFYTYPEYCHQVHSVVVLSSHPYRQALILVVLIYSTATQSYIDADRVGIANGRTCQNYTCSHLLYTREKLLPTALVLSIKSSFVANLYYFVPTLHSQNITVGNNTMVHIQMN